MNRRKGRSMCIFLIIAVLLCANVLINYGSAADFLKPILKAVFSPASDEIEDIPPEDVVVTAADIQIADIGEVTEGLPEGYLAQMKRHELSQTDAAQYTDSEIVAIKKFYSKTVFVGDSLMLGFRTYIMRRDKYGCFSDSLVLASTGYSTVNANDEISENSIHPFYKSKQRHVWDSIKLFGAKRVVLSFWANEFSRGNIKRSQESMEKLVKKIAAKNPGIEIYVISPCYRYNGAYVGVVRLTNENINLLAQAQREICEQYGGGYIEIAKYLGNITDGMYEEYSQDQYVHVNNAAYDIWQQVLMDYALGRESVIDNGHEH